MIVGLDPEAQAFATAELQAVAAELEARATHQKKDRDDQSEEARQLLLGLLASERGLIDSRVLLAGYRDWSNQAAASLGSALVNHQAITPERLAAMEELLDAHLAKHEDSVTKGLSALRIPGSFRTELEQVSNPVLLAKLAQVGGAGASYQEGSSSENGAARYQILQPLDQGGMGKVSVALDGELHRRVALKEIRESAATDARYRARFLAEAELTGKLEHPGIIPIYNVGRRDDGQPFYTMRLIQGESSGTLKAAIDAFHGPGSTSATERELAFQGLVRRVLDVCNTIEYAHSRSVIHRDLKPANILLGPYGETLVVDWGLAKVLADQETESDLETKILSLSPSSSVESTVPGQAVGTPEYAAPEQIAGERVAFAPASDIYALGGILYYLLTGKTPFTRRGTDADALKQQILSGQFSPPHLIQTGVDRALEAICLKALQTRPENRYPSALAMKQDLERYLANEPVTVYQEPLPVRLRRWISRHRTLAASVFVGLLATALGLAANSAVQLRAAKELAAEHLLTEQREQLAVDAVRHFRSAVADDPALKNSPALAPLRGRLLQEPLRFFQTLQDDLEQNLDTKPETLARLAETCSEHARLLDELGQYPKATELLERCSALYQNAIQRSVEAPRAWRIAEVEAESHRAALFRKMGDNDRAFEGFQGALQKNQELLKDAPDDLDLLAQTAKAQNHLATLHRQRRQLTEARTLMDQVLAVRTKIASTRPDQKADQLALAGVLNNHAMLLFELGERPEAEAELDQAIALQQKLSEQFPGDQAILGMLEGCSFNKADRLFEAGRTQEGIDVMVKVMPIRQKLVHDYPSTTEHRVGLARNYSRLGSRYRQTGRLDAAVSAQQQALEEAETLVKLSPDASWALQLLVEQRQALGQLFMAADQTEPALQAFEQALFELEKLAALSDGVNPETLHQRVELLTHLIERNLDKGDVRAAQLWLKQVVAARRELAKAGDLPGRPLLHLRHYLQDLERFSNELGDAETAADARRQLDELPEDSNGPHGR